MDNKTLDNFVIKLRVATFIALIGFIVVATFHVTNTMNKIKELEKKDVKLDERITKTTGRNASSIKDLQKED